mmetsp:Transcript_142210/g.370531  ORF Transcript_142210/g.370531 Transcript_142210/m.370531 type:complete len:246 (-) Transcript_142210:463-1200(-)
MRGLLAGCIPETHLLLRRSRSSPMTSIPGNTSPLTVYIKFGLVTTGELQHPMKVDCWSDLKITWRLSRRRLSVFGSTTRRVPSARGEAHVLYFATQSGDGIFVQISFDAMQCFPGLGVLAFALQALRHLHSGRDEFGCGWGGVHNAVLQQFSALVTLPEAEDIVPQRLGHFGLHELRHACRVHEADVDSRDKKQTLAIRWHHSHVKRKAQHGARCSEVSVQSSDRRHVQSKNPGKQELGLGLDLG